MPTVKNEEYWYCFETCGLIHVINRADGKLDIIASLVSAERFAPLHGYRGFECAIRIFSIVSALCFLPSIGCLFSLALLLIDIFNFVSFVSFLS